MQFNPRSVRIASITSVGIVVIGIAVSNAAQPVHKQEPTTVKRVAPGPAAVEIPAVEVPAPATQPTPTAVPTTPAPEPVQQAPEPPAGAVIPPAPEHRPGLLLERFLHPQQDSDRRRSDDTWDPEKWEKWSERLERHSRDWSNDDWSNNDWSGGWRSQRD